MNTPKAGTVPGHRTLVYILAALTRGTLTLTVLPALLRISARPRSATNLCNLKYSRRLAAFGAAGNMSRFNWWMRACGVFLLWATTAITLPAQTFTTLDSFNCADGYSYSYAGLVQATDGNLYGTTPYCGASSPSYGMVFKITTSGKLTTLYSFDGTDGYRPQAGLVQATDGNLYGTTAYGGANQFGTVFKITTGGTLTTLHSFDSPNGTDGAYPFAGLVQATDGNLYGTTYEGGANGFGTVFKITRSGTLTTLHSFCPPNGCTDGSFLQAGLVQATNGNLYGTTSDNGFANNGLGTVFKITTSGTLTTLHTFDVTDGQDPTAGLVQATDGNLYGTTFEGGANLYGTVFKITPGGTLTTLHSFDITDGAYPQAGLVQATDGDLYGTTLEGGANGLGTVFKITPSGTLTTLHSFVSPDGDPYAGLIQATDGNFYGTTLGDNGDGTIFSLSMGLKAFLEIQSTSGKEGAKVGMLGQGFSSSSVVKFGGTKATTIVLSGTTYITATVPPGALTGSVTVATGSTTLTSTKNFNVTPTMTSFSPSSGAVGTLVTITGTGLKQTIKVTFSGKSASFTVVSDTEVTATVPTGATTGKIIVTTKGGSVTSATSFTVN
jgi:uncharacterized repeat protein (TIGR03803 family)